MILIALILGWVGLCLGSFINALVWRMHEQAKSRKPKTKSQVKLSADKDKLSILNGRSICPNCQHRLAWYELVPVFSWLYLRGKCRYCKKPISVQYPLVELTAGLVFALSYLLWPLPLDNGQLILLAAWLVCSVGLLALLIYDLRWMLLPDKILLPTAVVAAAGRLVYIIGFEPDKLHAFYYWLLSLGIAAGIFWILYQVSDRLIGGGDIKLGLVTGTLLADPSLSFLMIFLASVIGTVVMMPALIKGNKNMTSKLPFGPFLIIATAIILFVGADLINWYSKLAFSG